MPIPALGIMGTRPYAILLEREMTSAARYPDEIYKFVV